MLARRVATLALLCAAACPRGPGGAPTDVRSQRRVAPYGGWRSPITPGLVVEARTLLGQVTVSGADTYWIEERPSEDGRAVVVRRAAGGRAVDLLPPPWEARSAVFGYGGGAFFVDGETLFFVNAADQRLYRQEAGGAPRPITPAAPMRYADCALDRPRGRALCVREDRRTEGAAVVTVVAVALDGGADPRVLVSGNDYYGAPRPSPDGKRLAWLTWNRPDMPWDAAELWTAPVAADGTLAAAERVAGGASESALEPRWSPDGVLYFVSDRTNWWNLYRLWKGAVEPVAPMSAECGRAAWTLGGSSFAFESPDRLVAACVKDGRWRLFSLDTRSLAIAPLATPYTDIAEVRAAPGRAVVRAGSPAEPWSVVEIDLASGEREILRRESGVAVSEGYLSAPEVVEFPTDGGQRGHGRFYRPRSLEFVGPLEEKPPLVVMTHAGPARAGSSALDLEVQYFTSRGFAVLLVDAGGSTGWGRAYRGRIYGAWGVADVADCVAGARYLARRDEVDPRRLIFRGKGLGGTTALAALVFGRGFHAGAVYHAVADLEKLPRDEHALDARWMERLVGPYPAERERWWKRSPIHYIDAATSPMIVLQGLDDTVVPPAQAERLVQALTDAKVPVAYVPFAGEGHGFRQPASIARALDAELSFYAQLFGIELLDDVPPIPITNLKRRRR